jgi:Precorrin-2 methylase
MYSNPILFVSLGPGEPELITLKGLRALQEADFILCPATGIGKTFSSRATEIIKQLNISGEKIHLFKLPMNKDRSQALQVYEEMYHSAIDLQQRSFRVVIVAEGDAGFYSSIHYIYDRLHRESIPAKLIPGIPAFIASGALAGLHIVQQEERLMVIPGKVSTHELVTYLEADTTVVIMKLSQCTDVIHEFITHYPTYHYHYFENVGTDKEYYSTDVVGVSAKRFPYFSLMIIKKNNRSARAQR